MANAVFTQNPTSIYDDQPGVRYHFPKRYLKIVEACVCDWVVFYESKQGAFGYTALQRLSHITDDPENEAHYYAWFDLNTLWRFEQVVPRNNPMGLAYETRLRNEHGRARSGGNAVTAVRQLSFEEFTSIVSAGLAQVDDSLSMPRNEPANFELPEGFGEKEQSTFEAPRLLDFRKDVLLSRPARDASFARMVKRAYKGRCAMSGLDLRNGGGRAEVQAAHIRPVKDNGPDDLANGLALSGTLHWMFDRGLLSVGPEYEILVSDNKVPAEVKTRLISPKGKLQLPDARRDWPHPEYLKYHRENIFGAVA